MDADTFTYKKDGKVLPYLYHSHNCGRRNSARRTERTVEIPIARHWLNTLRDCSPKVVVEVGAVTPYYWRYEGVDIVVDPIDTKATYRESVFNTTLRGCHVLSISTLEHIGERRYGLSELATPMSAMQKIIDEADNFLVTVPYGWSANPAYAQLESFLLDLKDSSEFRLFTLTRRMDETWIPDTNLRQYGVHPKPWANSIIVVERGGLL